MLPFLQAAIAGTGLILIARRGLQARVARRRRLTGADSIDASAFWEIGGVPQAVQIRGGDVANPILLWLHGGPGFPMMPFAHAVQSPWEEHYTVVHWDQRNTGKTFIRNGVQRSGLGQHAEDGLDLCRQLRERFPGRPLVLVGHSWGTAVAVEMLRRAPGLFAAYLAIGQVSDFRAAERYGYERVRAEAEGTAVARRLARIPDYPWGPALNPESLKIVRAAQIGLRFMHHRRRFVMQHLLWLTFQSPDYSWRDLLSLGNRQAGQISMQMALEQLPAFYDQVAGSHITCPVIMVGGARDLFTPTPFARRLFDTLTAPEKHFIEVEDLAHVGPLEAPALFDALINDRLLSLIEHPQQFPAPGPA